MKSKVNNRLNDLFSQLGIQDIVVFRDKEGQYPSELHFDIQYKLRLINPDAIYVFNNQPLILFFDLSGITDISIENNIHKKVWSFDNSPIILIIKNSEIAVYNALNYIKAENSLERIYISDSEIIDKFSFWKLQDNTIWKWFQEKYIENNKHKETKKRANERLFQNIKDVRNALIDKQNDPDGSIPNSLILKLIFIRYLIDREIEIDTEYISGGDVHARRKSFSTLIQNKDKLCHLFAKLNDRFNGVLFRDVDIALTSVQSEAISNIFNGEIPEKGTLFYGGDYYFDIFDFSIIPVEIISGIYESLIDPETRDLQSAVYTPAFLVEYILNDTVDVYLDKNNTSECKLFEVAVGSGIFLVQSLRRMIEQEILLNGNHDKKAFSERIRDIAKNNLYGVDINKEALKVCCFSIYIALLDYQEPRNINEYMFPNFLGENLFEANFFDIDHEFNKVINKLEPNYILGNPPWKSNKDSYHLKWLEDNKKTVGRFEIAQSFLLRTKDFMRSHTKAALVITSTIFYNVSKTTRKFKNDFLTTFCVDKFFDLSPVRRLIFEEKDSPASVVYYRISEQDEHLKNLVEHQSVKINYFLKHFKMFVIEKFDQKVISQFNFIRYDWMFKVALYGNTLDFNLFKKLDEIDKRIIDLIDGKTVYSGAGIERGKDAKPYPDLIGMPIIENRQIRQDYTKVYYTKIMTVDDAYLSRGRDKNIFIGSKILFKEQNQNESNPVVSYTETDCVFRKGTFSISSNDDSFIRVLYAYLKSDLYIYYLFLKSAAWGVATRPAVRFQDEILSFPYLETSQQIKQELSCLVGEILEKYLSAHTAFKLGEVTVDKSIHIKINDLINQLYEIGEHEKDLIDYVLKVSRYQFQESKQDLVINFTDDESHYRYRKTVLNRYAQIYLFELEKIYNDEFIQVEIFYLGHFIAMNFMFYPDPIDEKIIFCEDKKTGIEILKRLSNNLSLTQITDTIDPTKNLFIQKDIKGFERNSLYIIKPNEYKCWHAAMAWYDISEFLSKIESAELTHQVVE